MKRILLLIAVFLGCFNGVFAQQIAFQKTYSSTGPSNQGASIIEQSNGDFIVCGIRSVPTTSSQYIGSVFLFRINNSGDTLWTKELGTLNDRELSYDMVQLPNSNLVIVGSINTPPNPATTDALVMYTDVSGNLIWQKRYGGSAFDHATGVAYDGNNIIVCGVTESYGAGDADAWLLKLNINGDTLWTKTFGGIAFDDAQDIIAINNEYVLTGGTYSYASGLYDDAWVIKLDAAGNQIWQKNYGLTDRVDWAWSIEPHMNQGVLTGYVFVGVKNTEENPPGNARGDLHFVKIDTSGNVVWDKTISGTPWRSEGYDVKQLKDRGFVISGYNLNPTVQSQQLYVIRTDSVGNVLWDTAYGTIDSSYYGLAVTATNDGGWAITGAVFNPNQPIRYIFVTRFNFTPMGINLTEAANADLIIYPNPTSGIVRVKTNRKVNNIRLISLDGRLIKSYQPSQQGKNITEINVDVKGVYILEVLMDEQVIRRKLTIL